MPVDIFKHKLQRSGRTDQHVKTQLRRSKRDLEEKAITIQVLKEELNEILMTSSGSKNVYGEFSECGQILKGLRKELKDLKHQVEGLEVQLIEVEASKSRLIALIQVDKSTFGTKLNSTDSSSKADSSTFSTEAQKMIDTLITRLDTMAISKEKDNTRIEQLEKQMQEVEELKKSNDKSESIALENQKVIFTLTKSIQSIPLNAQSPSISQKEEAELAKVLKSKFLALDQFKLLHKSVKDSENQLAIFNDKTLLAVKEVVDAYAEQVEDLEEILILQERESSSLKIKLKPARSKRDELRTKLSTQRKIFEELAELVRSDKSRTKRLNSNISNLTSQITRAQKELKMEAKKRISQLQSSSTASTSRPADTLFSDNESPLVNWFLSNNRAATEHFLSEDVQSAKSLREELLEREGDLAQRIRDMRREKLRGVVEGWNEESRRNSQKAIELEEKVGQLSNRVEALKSDRKTLKPPSPSTLASKSTSLNPFTFSSIGLINNLKKKAEGLSEEVSLLRDENTGLPRIDINWRYRKLK